MSILENIACSIYMLKYLFSNYQSKFHTYSFCFILNLFLYLGDFSTIPLLCFKWEERSFLKIMLG